MITNVGKEDAHIRIKVLFEDKSAKEAVYDLMLREKRVESNALDWK